VSVVLGKVTGSAQVLLDDFVAKLGGPTEIPLCQLVAHLEKKFIIKSSPLHADAELHSIQQGVLTYSQLQAKIQRLVRLGCPGFPKTFDTICLPPLSHCMANSGHKMTKIFLKGSVLGLPLFT
jgi:hypothetical protein